SQSSSPRIVWNIARQQFTLANEGTGWSELYPDQQEAATDHGTEVRKCMLNFASENQWVWDYADTGTGRRGAAHIPNASPLVGQPGLVDDLISLTAPVITPASGTFNHQAFPLALSIANANASGVSDIMYQVNGGAWLVWQGGQSPLQKSLTTTVSAFAQAREMSAYSDSPIVTETYISYFLRGQGSGTFLNPAGDNQFLYSLNPDGSLFSWGKADASGQSVSSLEMIPSTTFEAGDGESFSAGSLRYTNGVTRAGTNARTATLRLDLALSVPAAGTVSMNVPVRMLNTIHYPWTPENEKVDYFWVPQYSTLSVPISVLNRHFTVTVLAQAPSAVVEGSDIKLTIAENASADVTFSATVSALD
ncbi:MAG TPA: choice-of-anchor K domain-containing protein, partial [Verrucomicrobiales bacterium]|nr:choice-of-anchor K domain-containing protein [Verrucomicrobiales bacterium]